MPAPLAKGIIITVTVLVAAGIAAYENPQVRAWVKQSKRKISVAFNSLGNDGRPRPGSPRQDASMKEEMSDLAEARRRQARAEIIERGRIMEERRQRRQSSRTEHNSQGSFDTLVDKDGLLRKNDLEEQDSQAVTTAVQPAQMIGAVSNRHISQTAQPLHESVDSPISLRQLDNSQPVDNDMDSDPFASRYEQEMRNTWNLPLPETYRQTPSTHASESLIDLTPTSEMHPDPEISVPNSTHLQHPLDRSEYFSAAASTASHTRSNDEPEFYYAHPSNPAQAIQPRMENLSRSEIPISVSSAPSIDGSVDHVHASDLEGSEDGVMSEIGDGVHTPASAWTEVGSVVSSDAGH